MKVKGDYIEGILSIDLVSQGKFKKKRICGSHPKSEERIKMKSLFVDTNCVNENGSICINDIVIENMKLDAGEKVIVYQDADSWEAEIVHDNNKWGCVLSSNARKISQERLEGQQEGFLNGCLLQSYWMLLILKELNYSASDIEIVKAKLGLK